jgi:S1-C subfamily serine protease
VKVGLAVRKRSDLCHLAQRLGGLAVYGCLPGSSAERAGVRYGDILLGVDGLATPTWDAYILAREHSGATIRLRLFRDGEELELDVELDRSARLEAVELAGVLGLLEGPSPGSGDRN